MKELVLPRFWGNDGNVREDLNGDQFAPEQVELPMWTQVSLSDKDGIISEPYKFMLSRGIHNITFTILQEALCIENIMISPPERIPDYKETLKENPNAVEYKGNPVIIQGEDADIKTANYLIPKADNSNAGLNPVSPKNLLINIIGGTSWSIREKS